MEQALNETPEKLNRDRRAPVLPSSDPVTMARLHYRGSGMRQREILFLR